MKMCLQVMLSWMYTSTGTAFVQKVKWGGGTATALACPEQAPVVPAVGINAGLLFEGNGQLEMGILVPVGVWVKPEITRSSWFPPRASV